MRPVTRLVLVAVCCITDPSSARAMVKLADSEGTNYAGFAAESEKSGKGIQLFHDWIGQSETPKTSATLLAQKNPTVCRTFWQICLAGSDCIRHIQSIRSPCQERLLHELIHHIQKVMGVGRRFTCRKFGEKEAYLLGGEFVKSHIFTDLLPNRYILSHMYS